MKHSGRGHGDQRPELALPGVPADVHGLGARVHHLGAPAVQVVDHPSHRPLVAGDGVGADHHDVVLADAQPLVVPVAISESADIGSPCDPVEMTHISAGRHGVDVLDVDVHAVGDAA